jgi:hypothetical protein
LSEEHKEVLIRQISESISNYSLENAYQQAGVDSPKDKASKRSSLASSPHPSPVKPIHPIEAIPAKTSSGKQSAKVPAPAIAQKETPQ